MTDNPTEISAVCHVRAPLLLEPVDEQVETLQACESEGAVDDLLLRSWPKEVALSEESPHQEVLENFERFAQWADERGVSVRPPFRKRTTTSQVTGTTRERLVTPLLCLELYADDELIGVFPHSNEATEETYTTDEAIATLRTGEVPTPLGPVDANEGRESAASTSDTCPGCGGSLIDGQGLFACGDCGWIGTIDGSGTYVSASAESAAKAEGEAEEKPVTQSE
ncbi:HTH domain-containing protein [Natrinema sp. DC36]|uniref:HTH domain-containing protein n=1 Tax=Natrinema sp. DC36 TaxID=2878680 RepID=UPI001CEFD3B0|nr:HTH domain-containing protein [Natrinema sp. DC36]